MCAGAVAQETPRLRRARHHWRKMGHPPLWGQGLGGDSVLGGDTPWHCCGVHCTPRKPPLAAEKAALAPAARETPAQPLGQDKAPRFLMQNVSFAEGATRVTVPWAGP